jgi:transcriptional regulator with XRE-family HTH domain
VRVYHDLTQAETARRVGFSKSYVSELESGNKKVSIEALERYAAAFKLPVSSLMIFAEHSENRNFTEDVRVYVAGKVLKMLDWISTISEEAPSKEKELHRD